MSEMENQHVGNERLTKVETEVAGIREEMSGMWRSIKDTKDAVDKVGQAIADSNKTDWMTFATVGGLIITVVVGLYAAAIHPIAADVERGNRTADKLAEAVLIQNEKFDKEREARESAYHEMDKAITILKYQLNHPSNP